MIKKKKKKKKKKRNECLCHLQELLYYCIENPQESRGSRTNRLKWYRNQLESLSEDPFFKCRKIKTGRSKGQSTMWINNQPWIKLLIERSNANYRRRVDDNVDLTWMNIVQSIRCLTRLVLYETNNMFMSLTKRDLHVTNRLNY